MFFLIKKIGAPPWRPAHFWSVGLSLGGFRAPFGGPFSSQSLQLSEVICSGSGGLLAAGKRPTDPEIADAHICLAPVRLVLSVSWASLFSQRGPGAREVCTVCTISTKLCLIFLAVFVKWGRRRDEKPNFDPWTCLLVAPGLHLRLPGAKQEVRLNTACVSQCGPKW